MLILLPTIMLLGVAAALGAVRFFRPRSRFVWLGALGAVIGTWLVVLIWQFEGPISLVFPEWGTTVALPTGPGFSVGSLTWVTAWSLTSLLLAGLIIGAAQPDFQPSASWALPLVFGGLALLALSAANALTLVMAWAALDLLEAGLALAGTRDRASTGSAVTVFAVRLGTVVIAMMGQVLGGADPTTDSYALVVLTAVLARILVQWRASSQGPPGYLRGTVGTTLQLSSAIATLGVLPRLKLAGAAWPYAGLLLLLSAAIALYAGWLLLRSSDLPTALPHALAGVSTLAMGASLLRNPAGAAAWTAALAVAFGALFMSAGRKTSLAPAILVGAWSLSALPFSLTGAGWPSQFGLEQWALPAFVLGQALLLGGFVQLAARPLARGAPQDQLTSLHAVRHLGLLFLIAVQLLLGIWGWEGSAVGQSLIPGAAATALGLALFAGRSRLGLARGASQTAQPQAAETSVSMIGNMASELYGFVRRLVTGVTSLLEGQAGIMWGLLLLALFVSLIVGGNP
jgi:hypothetical protein